MLNLNYRRSKKYINYLWHPSSSGNISIFHQKLAIFVLSGIKGTNFIYELLFRHIFETQIHVQTQIQKTFILALATNDLL